MSLKNLFKQSFSAASVILALVAIWPATSEGGEIPHLRRQGTAAQLIVEGKPFLVLGGELGNSTSSSLEYIKPIWQGLIKLNLNTVLAPVYWDLTEPNEGTFDFSLVDGLIGGARHYNLRLVLLWFASWKNSMSCYAPVWIKTNQERFPRAQDKDGNGMEILSAFSSESRDADARAFAALMKHIREVDGQEHTVIMVQVENEVGMIPDSRDRSVIANELFGKNVPKELIDYLQEHKETLIPEFRKIWEDAGFRTSGTWEEIFSKGVGTDEIFMAWHYASYINQVVKVGKAEYPLPMFVNAALIRPNYKPGQYPSAGPLPHLIDVWRAGAPLIDFFAPDIYFTNFAEWCQKYHRCGNPLFIPETSRADESAANVFYAIGQHDAIGFCPFSIESISEPNNDPIAQSYEILTQLMPMILENQGKGTMAGVLLDKDNQTQQVSLGDYILNVSHDYTWAWSSGQRESQRWPRVGGIIVSIGPNDYVIAGTGIIVTFKPSSPEVPMVGIAGIQEGTYKNGRWIPGRWMNGDQSHQGRHLRIPPGSFSIQRISLYRYR